MLEIQKFIKEYSMDWRKLLTSDPYNLSIKEKDDRIMFNYRQGISDYGKKLVLEARGLILDKNTFDVICIGFDKFFLFDSEYASSINWHEVRIEEKYDGSLITLYYYNNAWKVATSGCIDAEDAKMECSQFNSFGQLFSVAANKCGLDYNRLDKDSCYMFELISPYNKVVVDYENIDIIHIGTRNKITLKERIEDIGIKHPITYHLNDIADCLAFVNKEDYHGEGFVAVDNMWNRIKIKSDEWFKWHYVSNNNAMNVRIALELIRSKDLDEYLTRYKHHKDYVLYIKDCYDVLRFYVELIFRLADYAREEYSTRKEQSEYWVARCNVERKFGVDYNKFIMLKDAFFSRLSKPTYTVDEFLDSRTVDKVEKLIKLIMGEADKEIME